MLTVWGRFCVTGDDFTMSLENHLPSSASIEKSVTNMVLKQYLNELSRIISLYQRNRKHCIVSNLAKNTHPSATRQMNKQMQQCFCLNRLFRKEQKGFEKKKNKL